MLALFCISDARLRRLSDMVYFRHMAGKKTTLKELGEMLTHVVEHMATKDDVRAIVRDELAPHLIGTQIHPRRKDLVALAHLEFPWQR